MTAGTKLIITLTPIAGAKYLDDSAVTTPVTETFTMQNNGVNYYMDDVPGLSIAYLQKAKSLVFKRELLLKPAVHLV